MYSRLQARVGVFTYAEVCGARCNLHAVGAGLAARRGQQQSDSCVFTKEIDGGCAERIAGQIGFLRLHKVQEVATAERR